MLVVIIIIGILAAIALPAFLNQANKAKQAEGKTNVGSLNRAQQAYYLEKGEFAPDTDFGKLGLGIKTQSGNYKFILIDGNGANNTAVTSTAQPVAPNATIKAYIGGVNAGTIAATKEATTLTVLCEGIEAPISGGQLGLIQQLITRMPGPKCPGTYNDVSTGKPSV